MKSKLVNESLNEYLRKKEIYQPVSPDKAIGTSFLEYVTTSYEKLVELFGLPNSEGDDFKTSTEWVLKDPEGNILTIYDYKATNLYYKDYPSIEEFRKLKKYEWHIGGNNKSAALRLINFLINSIGALY